MEHIHTIRLTREGKKIILTHVKGNSGWTIVARQL